MSVTNPKGTAMNLDDRLREIIGERYEETNPRDKLLEKAIAQIKQCFLEQGRHEQVNDLVATDKEPK